METLELPVAEELEEGAQWAALPNPTAFELWRQASQLDAAATEESTVRENS